MPAAVYTDPSYEALPPNTNAPHPEDEDHHIENVEYAEDSDDESAPKQSKELMKVAIVHSSRKTVLRVILYLLPLGISFSILQLSFRHVYWRGTERPDSGYLTRWSINQVLNILQIVAKAHEILIVLSLSHLVLHYLRKQLLSSDGIVFGLLSSAYQVTLGSAPFSRGFWYACRRCMYKETFNWRTLGLISLLILVTALGLTVGPASAIAVIPRLQWWYYQDLFTFFEEPNRQSHDFQMYIPKQLFPTAVDESSLPGSYCMNASLDPMSTCPFAGFDMLLSLFNITDDLASNLTISDGTGLDRRMTTQLSLGGTYGLSSLDKAGNHTIGGTRAWTQNYVIANYLSLGWNSGIVYKDPYKIEVKAQQAYPLNPLVNVTCEMEPNSVFARDLSFFNRPYGNLENFGPAGPDHDGTFDIR